MSMMRWRGNLTKTKWNAEAVDKQSSLLVHQLLEPTLVAKAGHNGQLYDLTGLTNFCGVILAHSFLQHLPVVNIGTAPSTVLNFVEIQYFQMQNDAVVWKWLYNS